MYEWSDLRLFLAVARQGSTLGAAKHLGLNQTTVSRRMQALEHALGLTLFDRQSRGYRLTDQGNGLLSLAEQVEKAADTPLDIVHGEADVAIRAGARPDDPRLVAQRLPDAAQALYCSENYARKNGAPSCIEDIFGHDLLGYTGGIGRHPGYLWFIAHADSARIVSHSNTVPNMTAVLRSGLGVGALPCFVGDQEADLIRCFDPPANLHAEFWLVTSEQARAAPQVRAFIDFAVPRIRAWKGRLGGHGDP